MLPRKHISCFCFGKLHGVMQLSRVTPPAKLWHSQTGCRSVFSPDQLRRFLLRKRRSRPTSRLPDTLSEDTAVADARQRLWNCVEMSWSDLYFKHMLFRYFSPFLSLFLFHQRYCFLWTYSPWWLGEKSPISTLTNSSRESTKWTLFFW